MFEIITIVLFIWLMGKAIGLAFKLTWGLTKLMVSLLLVLAFPALLVCMLFVGGLALLIPLAVVGIAVCILKACV